MSKIEDAEKLVGILETLKEFVSDNKLYKVLGWTALVAAMLLLIGLFPAVRAILDPIYTTLRMIFVWTLVLGVTTTSLWFIVDKCEGWLQSKKRRREEAEARAIAEAEAEHEREVVALINEMSDAERKIFSLME